MNEEDTWLQSLASERICTRVYAHGSTHKHTNRHNHTPHGHTSDWENHIEASSKEKRTISLHLYSWRYRSFHGGTVRSKTDSMFYSSYIFCSLLSASVKYLLKTNRSQALMGSKGFSFDGSIICWHYEEVTKGGNWEQVGGLRILGLVTGWYISEMAFSCIPPFSTS